MEDGREDRNPWTKWFWQDWESDIGLQLCSLAAQGLWMHMLSVMARSKNKGYLLDGEKQMESKMLAKKARSTTEETIRFLEELENHNVYSRTSDGIIYNRRMVREASLSKIHSDVGKLGGRPKKQKESKRKAKVKQDVKALSASASASASLNKNPNNKNHKGVKRLNKKHFIDKWNEFAAARKLAEIQSITGQREVHLKARISSEDFFSFDELLKTIDEQPWLLGKNEKGWRITFDWIIGASNYTKIMEKNYLSMSPAREKVGQSQKKQTPEEKKRSDLIEAKREELYKKYKKDFEDLREKKDQRGTELLESIIKTEVANYSKEI